mmetsp:Transcript_68604/g.174177  ORF Transcript_68604/g.174177 Transcript_68604/m.174177 type:complete len:386 (+) Transcript_68604:647-1804(+)
MPGQVQRVLQQHGDGHRPHASGHGRDPRSDALGRREVHIADEAVPQFFRGVLDGVDADVDDNAARLQPLALHEVGLADGSHDDVGLANEGHHVLRARVAHGDSGIHGLQELRHRHAHDVGSADDHGVLASDLDAGALDELDAPGRRAGHGQRRVAALQAEVADVHGRETVGVLLHLDGLQYRGLVDVLRERQLHEDGMHLGVVVELLDLGKQLRLARGLLERHVHRVEVDLRSRCLLIPDVRLRVLSATHQDHGQARRDTVLPLELIREQLYLGPHIVRDGFAVDALRVHLGRAVGGLRLNLGPAVVVRLHLGPAVVVRLHLGPAVVMRLHLGPAVGGCCCAAVLAPSRHHTAEQQSSREPASDPTQNHGLQTRVHWCRRQARTD